MKRVLEVAHRRGVHVTGHLEIVDVREAVKLGLTASSIPPRWA